MFDERLQCTVFTMVVNFTSHTGLLIVEDGHCPDMSACVAAFVGANPKLTEIDVCTADQELVNQYAKRPKGWECTYSDGVRVS